MKRGDIFVNVVASLLLVALFCVPAAILIWIFGWQRTDALLIAVLWAIASEFVRRG